MEITFIKYTLVFFVVSQPFTKKLKRENPKKKRERKEKRKDFQIG